MSDIVIYLDGDFENPITHLYFGEIVAPETFEDFIIGEPLHFIGRLDNISLREITLHLVGEGAENVQLARGDEEIPGVWAAPGESIIISTETLFAGDAFDFWARAVYNPNDDPGRLSLALTFQATQIG